MDLTQNTQERGEIAKLSDYPVNRKKLEMLREYGIRLLRRSKRMFSVDCKEWALTRLYLEDLDVEKGNIPDVLQLSDMLEPDMLVVYHFPERSHYSHYGVSVQEEEHVFVHSKWGCGSHLFSHPVDKVPDFYGTQADFFHVDRRRLSFRQHDILFSYD